MLALLFPLSCGEVPLGGARHGVDREAAAAELVVQLHHLSGRHRRASGAAAIQGAANLLFEVVAIDRWPASGVVCSERATVQWRQHAREAPVLHHDVVEELERRERAIEELLRLDDRVVVARNVQQAERVILEPQLDAALERQVVAPLQRARHLDRRSKDEHHVWRLGRTAGPVRERQAEPRVLDDQRAGARLGYQGRACVEVLQHARVQRNARRQRQREGAIERQRDVEPARVGELQQQVVDQLYLGELPVTRVLGAQAEVHGLGQRLHQGARERAVHAHHHEERLEVRRRPRVLGDPHRQQPTVVRVAGRLGDRHHGRV